MYKHTIFISEHARAHNFDIWTCFYWNVHTSTHVPVLTPRHCTGLPPLTDTHKVGLSVSSRAAICVTSAAAPPLPPALPFLHAIAKFASSFFKFYDNHHLFPTMKPNAALWCHLSLPIVIFTVFLPALSSPPPFLSLCLPFSSLLLFPFSPCAWRSMIICLYNDYNEFFFLFLVMRDAIAALMLLDPSETGGSLGGSTWWCHPMCIYFIC